MPAAANHRQDAHTLVIEGNLQSRSILLLQLRELGVGTVSPCSRLVEARRKLQANRYEVVICEQHFDRDSMSGQDRLEGGQQAKAVTTLESLIQDDNTHSDSRHAGLLHG